MFGTVHHKVLRLSLHCCLMQVTFLDTIDVNNIVFLISFFMKANSKKVKIRYQADGKNIMKILEYQSKNWKLSKECIK